MSIIISTFAASAFCDGGRDYTVTVTDGAQVIRGTATAMFDDVNNEWSARWASSPDMWLSDALIDYASDVAAAIEDV